MIDFEKLKKIQKKKFKLRDLELFMEKKNMSEVQKSNNFRPIGEREAAILLGVSYSKIKTLRREKKIPFLRIGRSVKYTISMLERFLENRIVEAE